MSAPASRAPAAAAPLLMGTLVGSLVAGRLEAGLLCLGLALAVAAAARPRWPGWRWRIGLALSACVGWSLNLYLNPGTPLGPEWPVLFSRVPTREGMELGALLTLRLAGAMVSVLGLKALWPGERAADALAGWLAPLERLRVPVRDARTVIGLALRFAPVLESEGRRIARVQALRAGRPPHGPGEWLRRRRAAAVPTLVASLERAERVALALEARGYRGRPLAAASRESWVTPWGMAGAAIAGVALFWRS